LTPLTIAQINTAVQEHKDDAFQVDNHELNQVSIVGTIKSVAKLSTNITLVVTDNTGEVDVRQWLDAADAQQDFQAGMRIKIIGHVREFQEKRSILAFKIIPVVDAEEAVHHQLMAQYVLFLIFYYFIYLFISSLGTCICFIVSEPFRKTISPLQQLQLIRTRPMYCSPSR
jgi:RecG-like helicase